MKVPKCLKNKRYRNNQFTGYESQKKLASDARLRTNVDDIMNDYVNSVNIAKIDQFSKVDLIL